jgi:hemoglobin-like flavoprotein
MKHEDIQTVRSSLALMQPVAQQAAAMFYDRLFEREPNVKALFRGDMVLQGERLMAMIGGAVQLLDQPAVLQGVLHDLGQRHAGYGVQAQHYDAVGGALLDTLAAALGSAFSAQVRGAWASFYADISTAMQSGAAALAQASVQPASV